MEQNRIAKLDKIDRCLMLLAFIGTLGFMSLLSLQLTIIPVLDEIGTITNAAYMAGYDWTINVQALANHYFKAGIAILYYPFMQLITDSVALYRCFLMVNAVLISLIPVFCYCIIKKFLLPTVKDLEHSVIRDRVLPLMIALTVGFLPSVDLHTLYAKADPMIVFLAWPLMLVLCEAYAAEAEGRSLKNSLLAVLASFIAVYAYFSHTRGIVIVIALVMTNAIVQLISHRKLLRWIPFLTSLLAFLYIESLVSGWFSEGIYIFGTEHSTVDSFSFEMLELIFTLEGFKYLIRMLAGWFFNLFVSTYGTVILGGLAGLIVLVRWIRNKKYYPNKEVMPGEEIAVNTFGLLNLAGAFWMGILFFYPYAYEFYTGFLELDPHLEDVLSGGDRLVFERYSMCAVGPVVMIGLFYLLYRVDIAGLKMKLAAFAVYVITCIGFITKAAPYLNFGTARTRYFISICTFVKYEYRGATSLMTLNLVKALKYMGILAGVIMAVMLVLASLDTIYRLLSRRPVEALEQRASIMRRRCLTLLMGILILYSFTITGINYYENRLARDECLVANTREPIELLTEIARQTDVPQDFNHIFVTSYSTSSKTYQLMLLDYVLGNQKTQIAQEDNYFVLTAEGGYLSYYYDDDYYMFDCFNYETPVRDVVFVKGHELAARLEAAGYTFHKYEGPFMKGKK